MKFLIVLVFLLTSCASMSGEWGAWVDEDVELTEREWDMCHEEKYGPDLHMKGFCWSLDECRTRKTVLGRTRKECRVKIVHCKFGDIACMTKYHLDKAVLIIK